VLNRGNNGASGHTLIDMNFDEYEKEQREEMRQRELRRETEVLQQKEKARCDVEFKKVNRRALANWPDEKLAAWQAGFPSDSPQFILAQFEWNRRLTADQVKAAHWAAWIGLAGVIVGAVLARLLEKL
jgi:hypothetical protein